MEYKYNYAESDLSPIRKSLEIAISPIRLTQYGLINHRLEDFYNKNGIKDIPTKNHMRHMGGSALLASPYWLGGRKTSKYWGDLKEGADIFLDKDDTDLDLRNNQIGRNIAIQNKNLKTDELLQKVYEEVLKRYNSNP